MQGHEIMVPDSKSGELVVLKPENKGKGFKKFIYVFVFMLLLVGGIMYVKDAFPEIRKESVATKKSKEKQQEDVFYLPNGYEVHPVKVNMHRIYAKNGLMVADKLTDGEKLVVQFDNGRELFFTLEQYDSNSWRLIDKGDVCSQVKQMNKNGVLVSEIYLPVAPKFVCYDVEADKVYIN